LEVFYFDYEAFFLHVKYMVFLLASIIEFSAFKHFMQSERGVKRKPRRSWGLAKDGLRCERVDDDR
jgi:hypothetical protein